MRSSDEVEEDLKQKHKRYSMLRIDCEYNPVGAQCENTLCNIVLEATDGHINR